MQTCATTLAHVIETVGSELKELECPECGTVEERTGYISGTTDGMKISFRCSCGYEFRRFEVHIAGNKVDATLYDDHDQEGTE